MASKNTSPGLKNKHRHSYSSSNLNLFSLQSPYLKMLPRVRKINLSRTGVVSSPKNVKFRKIHLSPQDRISQTFAKQENSVNNEQQNSMSFAEFEKLKLKNSFSVPKLVSLTQSNCVLHSELERYEISLKEELDLLANKLTSLREDDFKMFFCILDKIIESIDDQKSTLSVLKRSLLLLLQSNSAKSDLAFQENQALRQSLQNLQDSLDKEKRNKAALNLKLSNLSKLNIEMSKQLEEYENKSEKYKHAENRGYGQDENNKKLIDELIAMSNIIRKQKEDIESLSDKELNFYRLIETLKSKGTDPLQILNEIRSKSQKYNHSKLSQSIPKLKLQNITKQEQAEDISSYYSSEKSEDSKDPGNSESSNISEGDELSGTYT